MAAGLFCVESSLGTFWAGQFSLQGISGSFSISLQLCDHSQKQLSRGFPDPEADRPDIDSDDKYIFLFTFVLLLCFLHHFLRLL